MGEGKAAIYHFTDGGNIRPIVYQKELARIKEFAVSIGYPDVEIYLDNSLIKKEQAQLRKMLGEIEQYETLIMKDFYHLRKNTGAFMSELIGLAKKNVSIKTIEDGSFRMEDIPFNKPLRVAIYYCGLEIVGRSIELQFEIMEYFIKKYTKWTLKGKYADTKGNKKDGNQKNLQELISHKSEYDIVLVQSFCDVHWRTAKFCKMRHLMQLDIFSMHEDMYLKYEGGTP